MKKLGTRRSIKLIATTAAAFLTALVANAVDGGGRVALFVQEWAPLLGAFAAAAIAVNNFLDKGAALAEEEGEENG